MKLGKYKHYKGKFYEVLGVALHTETREILVVYKPLYDAIVEELEGEPLFVRPKKMFEETLEFEGKQVKRFEFVEN